MNYTLYNAYMSYGWYILIYNNLTNFILKKPKLSTTYLRSYKIYVLMKILHNLICNICVTDKNMILSILVYASKITVE